MNLNIDNWKEFEVGNLFDAVTKTARTKTFTKQTFKDETYKIPALSSKSTDNSFGFYVKKEDHNLINGPALSVISNGDAGKIFVQNKPFAIAQDAYALKLKKEKKKHIDYLFLATVLEKTLINKYSYENKAGWNKVKNLTITLPATFNQTANEYEPDWDFMEEYIKEIEQKYIEKVDVDNQARIQSALTFTGLTEADINKDLIIQPALRYEEFKIGDLFDGVTKTAKIKTFTKQTFKDETYNIPALSSVTTDNSLGFYVKQSEHNVIRETCLSVTANGINTGTLFLQNKPFAIAQDAYVIKLKNQATHKTKIYLYLKTVIEKMTQQIYNYENKAGWNKVKNLTITLPAIDKDTPDWNYMENAIYIYILKKSFDLGNWITNKKSSC